MRLRMLAPQAVLTLPDGSEVHVTKLGKGRYTTAWRNCENVYLQVSERDYSKEILAGLAQVDRNKHIPDCKELERADGNSPFRWYQMPLYQPLTAKSGKAWEEFKLLKQIMENAWSSLPFSRKEADALREAVREMVDDATYLSDSIKEAVNQLVDEAANYGEYSIEFSKRNCAVDGNEVLILLDPLFDLSEVRRARSVTRNG